jgi:predicted RNase H-like HicB family nuclease
MKIMRFRVTIEVDEDGMFVVQCPSLPGCISQGRTREEALENIRDAIKGYLESLKKHGEPIPAVDTLIAAVALNRELIIVTKDRHFDFVREEYPKLRVEYW